MYVVSCEERMGHGAWSMGKKLGTRHDRMTLRGGDTGTRREVQRAWSRT